MSADADQSRPAVLPLATLEETGKEVNLRHGWTCIFDNSLDVDKWARNLEAAGINTLEYHPWMRAHEEVAPQTETWNTYVGDDRLWTSKAMMKKAGLPVIPGTEALSGLEEALKEAESIGYPVMLKARSGGGGRGIRVIRTPEELEKAYATAEAESKAAFGDGALYLEKYIYPARHIEVQILADESGQVLCLGERDCSVQRRHQKLIEESPSPAVDAAQREKLTALVRESVPKIGYVGAGTLGRRSCRYSTVRV